MGEKYNINTPTDPDDPTSGDYGYDYDSAGRLIELSMPDAKAVGYELDDNGNRTKLIYPDGYYASYFYDELNRLTDIKLNGSSTAAVHFDYDDLSRRTLVTYENGCTCDYAYAINDDLTALNQEFTGSAVNYGYSYNKVHQAIAMSCSNKAFVWTPVASATTVYSAANNLNQYPSVAGTGYSYNKNGCLTGGPFSAAFDVLNRMTQVVLGGTTNDYILDPVDRQARKTSNTAETNFSYDGQQMIAEFDDGDALVSRFIRGNRADEILIKISGSTKTYLHHDRLGSVIAQTDDSGAVLNRYKYGPFGETPSLTGTPFGYTGQRYDSEVGLYNYKARIYSPAIGRFLQPDPIGFSAGDMNLYTYVGNDAVNMIDSAGLTVGAGGNYKAPSSPIAGGGYQLPIVPPTPPQDQSGQNQAQPQKPDLVAMRDEDSRGYYQKRDTPYGRAVDTNNQVYGSTPGHPGRFYQSPIAPGDPGNTSPPPPIRPGATPDYWDWGNPYSDTDQRRQYRYNLQIRFA